MTVTIREVADAAGVSTATVSRTLSGVQTVDPVLAERVRRSAESLGYRANRVARALRRQSTQTVGVVIPDITNPLFPVMVQVIEHLTAQGCRSFGYISPGPEIPAARERLDAFTARVRPLDPAAPDRIYLGDYSVAWGREAAARLLARGPLPDAIVCASDQGALGAQQVLRGHGVRVPDDVAITGFDDTVLAEACDPRLTTVRQPLHELGTQAVTALRAAIGPGTPPRSAVRKAELVIRGSSRRAGQPADQASQ